MNCARTQALAGLVLRLVLFATALRSARAQYCPSDAVQTRCDSILLIGVTTVRLYISDVQAKLRAAGNFATIDFFPAVSGTPSASQLAAYDAVLVFSGGNFFDSVLLGDRLAAYHDQGGGVVVAAFGNSGLGAVRGAYANISNGYALMDYSLGSSNNPRDSLGDLLEPQSPLLLGVASFSAYWGDRSTSPVISGRGVVVARWRYGNPLVVRGRRGNRTLVELTLYPPSNEAMNGYWTGDGGALMRNALKYSRCIFCGGLGTFSEAGAECLRL
jgi:hypothetical protein